MKEKNETRALCKVVKYFDTVAAFIRLIYWKISLYVIVVHTIKFYHNIVKRRIPREWRAWAAATPRRAAVMNSPAIKVLRPKALPAHTRPNTALLLFTSDAKWPPAIAAESRLYPDRKSRSFPIKLLARNQCTSSLSSISITLSLRSATGKTLKLVAARPQGTLHESLPH